jgi:hypothetical protein
MITAYTRKKGLYAAIVGVVAVAVCCVFFLLKDSGRTSSGNGVRGESNPALDTAQPQGHVIVIENVRSNEQLLEILGIIENYSQTQNISDLNIRCVKMPETGSP